MTFTKLAIKKVVNFVAKIVNSIKNMLTPKSVSAAKAETDAVIKRAQEEVAAARAKTAKVEADVAARMAELAKQEALDKELHATMMEIHALARVHKYSTTEAIAARLAKDKETLIRIKEEMHAGVYVAPAVSINSKRRAKEDAMNNSRVVKMRKPQRRAA
jgi:hypothetical protein